MQGYYILAAVVKLRVISQLFLTLEAKFEFNHTSPHPEKLLPAYLLTLV